MTDMTYLNEIKISITYIKDDYKKNWQNKGIKLINHSPVGGDWVSDLMPVFLYNTVGFDQ